MKKPEKIVVYTAIINNYDVLRNPSFIDPTIDYVCFTDQPRWFKLSTKTIWQIRPIPDGTLDATRLNRLVKLQPHVYFPEYGYSVYVDGGMDIIGDIRALLEKYGYPAMLSFAHPLRNCIYEEGEVCIQKGKEDPTRINAQLAVYQAEGHPRNFGMIEANVLIRRHNDPVVKKVMNEWWHEVQTRSRRDQLSFPYVARRNAFWPTVMGKDHALRASAYFSLRTNIGHRRSRMTLAERARILADVHLAWRISGLTSRLRSNRKPNRNPSE